LVGLGLLVPFNVTAGLPVFVTFGVATGMPFLAAFGVLPKTPLLPLLCLRIVTVVPIGLVTDVTTFWPVWAEVPV
jgi:hypothetical protein